MEKIDGQLGRDEMPLPGCPALTFTPVNQGLAVVIPMHRDVSHRARGIDRNKIYDFQEQLHQTAKKRKRALPNAMHSDAFAANFEEIGRDDVKSYPKGFVQDPEPAQIKYLRPATPPDSKRMPMKKKALPRRQKQTHIPGLRVIKPRKRPSTFGTPKVQPIVASCHMTTEDMVRFGDNILAKSTVENLANFSCNPPSITPMQGPRTTAAADIHAKSFMATYDFKNPAEPQGDEVIELERQSSVRGLDHAALSNPSFDEASLEHKHTSNVFAEPIIEHVSRYPQGVEMSSGFLATSVAAQNSDGEDLFDQANELQNQQLQDEDLWAITDSVFENASNHGRLSDEITCGTVLEHVTKMANLELSPKQSLDDGDCFAIDEDTELAMTTLANPDIFESTQQSSNPELALDGAYQKGVLEMSPQNSSLSYPTSIIAGSLEDIVSRDKCDHRSTQECPLTSNKPSSLPVEASGWSFSHGHGRYSHDHMPASSELPPRLASSDEGSPHGSSDYSPMRPFARPDFPSKVRDRSPVIGFTSSAFLRTCFRIGEAIRTGGMCDAPKQGVVIELFARIKHSSRESGTSKQHFQFADLFHDRPPYLNAILENFKVSALQETESSKLVGEDKAGQLVRSIGRLTNMTTGSQRIFHMVNVRATDWEEVRWTRMIAGAGMAKSVVDP